MVSAASLCQGYFGDAELTRKCFVQRDGKTFFKTGDYLSLREDGYVSFIGRERRFFFANGVCDKVNCETIEEIISGLNGVSDNAVIVTPDEAGCRAFVVLEDEFMNNETAREEFKQNLAKALKEYQMPREIRFVEEIPMMSSGKVDYKKLETM